MFDRIKKWLGKAADVLRGKPKTETFEVAPIRKRRLPVKLRIPRSAFTKKGPGVTAALRKALRGMARWERLYAKHCGWDKGLVDKRGNVR